MSATAPRHIYKYMPVGATNANPNPRLDTLSAEPPSLALARPIATGDGGWEKMLTAPLITLASGSCKPTLESCAGQHKVGYFSRPLRLRCPTPDQGTQSQCLWRRCAALVSTPQTIVDNHGTEQAQFPYVRAVTGVLVLLGRRAVPRSAGSTAGRQVANSETPGAGRAFSI